MTFTEITAVFTVYGNNFKVIHWSAIGRKFDRIHSISKDYYDMIEDDLDVLAEMGMRINQPPAVMSKCIDIMGNIDNHNFLVIDKYEHTNYEHFCKMTGIMLKDICYCIEELLDSDEVKNPHNVGIKATLEGLHDKYDIQARYLNDRRCADCE